MTARGRGLTVALGALSALALIVAAAAASEAGAGPVTVDVRIHHSRYVPAVLDVPAGRPVRFVFHNEDPIEHEWIVGDAQVHDLHRSGTEARHLGRPSEVSIPALGTVETVITFPARASLPFICHLPGHERYGMVGTLTIR